MKELKQCTADQILNDTLAATGHIPVQSDFIRELSRYGVDSDIARLRYLEWKRKYGFI